MNSVDDYGNMARRSNTRGGIKLQRTISEQKKKGSKIMDKHEMSVSL